MYFTGFDGPEMPRPARVPRLLGQDGLMIEPSGAVMVEIPSRVIAGYEAMVAEAERIG